MGGGGYLRGHPGFRALADGVAAAAEAEEEVPDGVEGAAEDVVVVLAGGVEESRVHGNGQFFTRFKNRTRRCFWLHDVRVLVIQQ